MANSMRPLKPHSPLLFSAKPRQQSGIALVMVLLIVALITVIAGEMFERYHLSLRRTTNIVSMNQAYQYALGAEAIAMSMMYDDYHGRDNQEPNKFDSADEIWADLPTDTFPIDDGFITFKIEEISSRFNVNSLLNFDGTVNAEAVAMFENLLEQFNIERQVVSAVVDWLDNNIDPSGPNGAEDDYYSGLDRPYWAANGPISSVSELRLVKGLDVENFDRLAAHLTALPRLSTINPNFASPQIHQAVAGFSSDQAEMVYRVPPGGPPASHNAENNVIDPNQEEQARAARVADDEEDEDNQVPLSAVDQEEPEIEASTPFESVDDYFNEIQPSAEQLATLAQRRQYFDVYSEYFLLTTTAEIDRGRVTLKSVLHRDKKNGIMTVVMRSQGDI